MRFQNYYEILRIRKNASASEIRTAYHKLAKEFHPDTSEGGDDKIRELNTAYSILSHPKKRKEYDSSLYLAEKTIQTEFKRKRPKRTSGGARRKTDPKETVFQPGDASPLDHSLAKRSAFYSALFGGIITGIGGLTSDGGFSLTAIVAGLASGGLAGYAGSYFGNALSSLFSPFFRLGLALVIGGSIGFLLCFSIFGYALEMPLQLTPAEALPVYFGSSSAAAILTGFWAFR